MESVELVYDVMSFMQQLRRASQQSGFQVIPNTLNLVILTNNDCPPGEARIIFDHNSPHHVMFATQVSFSFLFFSNYNDYYYYYFLVNFVCILFLY